MIAEARRLGMDALVEVHDEAEMQRAVALGAPLIGINNRDLRDLSIDLATTERLARLAPGRILVSESGIESRADVERLAPEVDGFLVGSSLMRAPRPGRGGEGAGLRPDQVVRIEPRRGFRAPRGRAAHRRPRLRARKPARRARSASALRLAPLAAGAPVGVFRNAPVETVAEAAMMIGLVAVQLHGARGCRLCPRARAPAAGRLRNLESGQRRARSPPERFDAADRLLFDNGDGGTGRTFDWTLIARPPRAWPSHRRRRDRRRTMPARRGGSALMRSTSARRSTRRPGRKSPDKIAALFDALRPPSRERLRHAPDRPLRPLRRLLMSPRSWCPRSSSSRPRSSTRRTIPRSRPSSTACSPITPDGRRR